MYQIHDEITFEPNDTAHQIYRSLVSLNGVYGYDPADDGPEVMTIRYLTPERECSECHLIVPAYAQREHSLHFCSLSKVRP